MKTYKIIKFNNKYSIIYFINDKQETIEHYAYDLKNPVSNIREGYTKSTESL